MINGRTFIPKKDMLQLANRCFNKHSYYVSGNKVRCGENYMYNSNNYITYIYFDDVSEYTLDKTKKYKAVLFHKFINEKMVYGHIYYHQKSHYNDVMEREVDDSEWTFVEEENVTDQYLTNINRSTKSVTLKLSEKQYEEIAIMAEKNKMNVSEYTKELVIKSLKD